MVKVPKCLFGIIAWSIFIANTAFANEPPKSSQDPFDSPANAWMKDEMYFPPENAAEPIIWWKNFSNCAALLGYYHNGLKTKNAPASELAYLAQGRDLFMKNATHRLILDRKITAQEALKIASDETKKNLGLIAIVYKELEGQKLEEFKARLGWCENLFNLYSKEKPKDIIK